MLFYMSNKQQPAWEFKAHSYQIADTGDYDGHYELTNGDITLLTKDDDDETERLLRMAAHFLNKVVINLSDAKVDDLSFQLHLLELEKKQLQERVKELEAAQTGAVWVKAELGKYDTYPVANKNVFIRYDENGQEKEVGDLKTIIELLENGWLNVEWLDESGTAANELPTFWDVAKAFKWAAEYSNERGESLSLYEGQWTILGGDGDEPETEDLTPGNVAELYCLQKGFTKENTAKLTQERADLIREANNRDLGDKPGEGKEGEI
jgi:hypothetical protein